MSVLLSIQMIYLSTQVICWNITGDPIATKHISTDSQWFINLNSLLLLGNRIYVPSASNLCTHILQYNYDHILAGHYSQNKILELVCHEYFWLSLCTDVQQFYKFCVTCMQFKPQHHKSYGSLKQLPILKQPQNSISIDFIKKLLSSSEFDTILIIVNQLTKQVIFISAHNTITSIDLVCLFVLYVFSKHSVPSYVISNRSLKFVSNFFHSLGTTLDMQLHFISDYHLKDNRQTKYMNQTLK